MKRVLTITAVLFVLASINAMAQSKVYKSSGGELIFSFADVQAPGEIDIRNVPRFSGFFHFQQLWNYDPADAVGFFSGVAMRNVGIITEPSDTFKLKQRAYALGIPLGIKLGSMDKKFFVFAGGEAEMLFHYKEKHFVNGDKVKKRSQWFSDKVNMFNPSLFAGVQLPGGANIKFKYYLFDFLNPDYTETVNGVEVKPYAGMKSQMMYVSLGFNIHKRKK